MIIDQAEQYVNLFCLCKHVVQDITVDHKAIIFRTRSRNHIDKYLTVHPQTDDLRLYHFVKDNGKWKLHAESPLLITA